MRKSVLWAAVNNIIKKSKNNKHKGPFAKWKADSTEWFCAEYLSKKFKKDIGLKITLSAAGHKNNYQLSKSAMEKTIKGYNNIKLGYNTKEEQIEVYNTVIQYIESIPFHSIEKYGFIEKKEKRKENNKVTKVSGINKDDAQESLTAFYVYYVARHPSVKFKDITEDKLDTNIESAPVENDVIKFKDIRKVIPNNSDWDTSCYMQSQAISSFLKKTPKCIVLDAQEIKNYGKKLHNDQAAKEQKMSKLTRKPGRRLPKISKADKFSTADIFVVDKARFNKKDLFSAKNIFEYIEKLQELFKNQILVGVSLKKINTDIKSAKIKKVNVVGKNIIFGRSRFGSNMYRLGNWNPVDNSSNKIGGIIFSNSGFGFAFRNVTTVGPWFSCNYENNKITIMFGGHTGRGAQIGATSGGTLQELIEIYTNNKSSKLKIPLSNELTKCVKSFVDDYNAKVYEGKNLFQIYKSIGGKKLNEKQFIGDFEASTTKSKYGKIASIVLQYAFMKDKKETGEMLRYIYNYIQASHDYGGAPYIKVY